MPSTKTNRQTLLPKPSNRGFTWLYKYSNTYQTDDMGRWECIGFYKGIRICCITGIVAVKDKPTEPPTVGLVNKFIVSTNFPVSSNDTGTTTEIFDSLTKAIKYTEKMFWYFKHLINK